MTQYKILIVGAGLSGLSAASCLMLAGHKVEIYEQAAQLAEVGAGIPISANAMHILHDLGLADAIRQAGVSPGAYVFRLHDTGEIIQRCALSEEHERLHGAPYTQLHRADLHNMLAAKAREFDPDIVRVNREATGFTESETGVELRFADGSTAHGNLLIGADGLKVVGDGTSRPNALELSQTPPSVRPRSPTPMWTPCRNLQSSDCA